MANLTLAALLRLLPSVSAMDVPRRQSYLRAVFQPDERSSARGIIGAARTAGAVITLHSPGSPFPGLR